MVSAACYCAFAGMGCVRQGKVISHNSPKISPDTRFIEQSPQQAVIDGFVVGQHIKAGDIAIMIYHPVKITNGAFDPAVAF